MAQFKGTIFTATKLFTEDAFGCEAVERCMQELDASDRELLRGISAVGWYPVEPILHYHHALERVCGNGGGFAVCERLGAFSAEWAIKGILKIFVRFKTPHFLLQKNGTVWSRYHDTGRWEMGPEAPTRLTGRLHDFAVRDEAFCARLRGWVAGAVEMTGGREPRVSESSCRCHGADYCEFVVEWQ